MTIFGQPIDAASFLTQEDFLHRLTLIFYDYCKAVKDPCGPEYDDSTCTGSGFMAGYCKHKCATYGPCSNNAECELDKNYKPFCNCGQRYEGPLCQYKKEAKKSLSEPETVGVALGAALVGLGLLSCCIFVFFCRKSKKNVKFTYYQDEEQLDRTSSDPTIPDYYIDRPQVSREPIRIFEPNLGFEA
ncbi:uncharacterized protein LOC112572465 [Pomacea canaliculata]|nr:uncharacterized protein LOC112572465 [Pomacea canaliculata]